MTLDPAPPALSDIAVVLLQDLKLWPWRPRFSIQPTRPEPIRQHYERIAAALARSAYRNHERLTALRQDALIAGLKAARKCPCSSMLSAYIDMGTELVIDNLIDFNLRDVDWSLPRTAGEDASLRAELLAIEPYLIEESRILEIVSRAIGAIAEVLTDRLPTAALSQDKDDDDDEDEPTLSTPLITLLADPAEHVRMMVATFLYDFPYDRDEATALAFWHTRERLCRNLLEASGIDEEQAQRNPRRLISPERSELPPLALVDAYLSGTPFRDLYRTPVPYRLPQAARFEHCHVVAGTGHGKTQLLQTLMLGDFDDPERPAVVAIDSQGDMLNVMSRLARFEADDRLMILDPADYDWPLTLNLFDVNRDRLDRLSPGKREQVLAGIIELYDYVFGALLGAELTQKQSVLFRYIVRMMLDIPGANIQTLRQLIEDPTPFQATIERQSPSARAFLSSTLLDRNAPSFRQFQQTRSQVLTRLHGVLANPVFERMYSHPRNALDMKAALDEGRIILINTAKDVLKSEASAIFGRTMIALVMQAALERAADAAGSRRPAYVYIDEAADYFDDNIDTMLIQARKYRVALTLAHQHLEQPRPELRASLMTNPGIRLAGGLSNRDARALAPEMRTSPEQLLSVAKRERETEFAAYVRHHTPAAITLTLPLGTAEREPRMSDAAYAAVRDRIRRQVAVPITETSGHISAAHVRTSEREEPESFGDAY